VRRLYICKKCDKPKSRKVLGKPLKGKKLARALAEKDLDLEIVPCKCLGKCKKGPNGLLMPEKKRLHRLTVKKVQSLELDALSS
jgi:predicted metal-binding protein